MLAMLDSHDVCFPKDDDHPIFMGSSLFSLLLWDAGFTRPRFSRRGHEL